MEKGRRRSMAIGGKFLFLKKERKKEGKNNHEVSG